ncbi:glycosyltransferase family 39 protein [candidate division KSB1 bacterium]|nr:glycosyltransferase family 39 protein [candidate division KSB1 bacterium]
MRKKDWLYLGLIIVGALLFRLIFLTRAYSIGFDEVNYLKLAASARLNGLNHAFHAYWSPLYPIAVALFSLIVSNFEMAGRFLAILCSVTLIVPLFFFVKTYYNKRIAYISSLLTAFYSFAVYFSVKAEAEFLYSLAALSGIFLGWITLDKRRVKYALWVGLLFGMCYLARPEGIGFLITFWGVLILILLVRLLNKRSIKSYVLVILLAGIGFGLISFPYLLYLRNTTGHWTISTKGTINQQGEYFVMTKSQHEINPFHSLTEDNKRLMEDEIYHLGNFVQNNDGQQVIKIRLSGVIKKIAENVYELFNDAFAKVFPLPVLIMFALGLFGASWKRKYAFLNLYLISYLIFFWLILIPAFHITLRYFVPLLPLGLIWVAKGSVKFEQWLELLLKELKELKLSRRMIRNISILVTIAVILIGAILPEFGKHMKGTIHSTEEWAPAIEQKRAGLWLKEHSDIESPIIMAYNHAVSFYAGNYEIKESVEIPYNKVDRLLEYARYRGVDYIVLDERYRHHHQLIDHLYEKIDVPDDLELVYEDRMKNGINTLIYKIKHTTSRLE